LWNKIENHRLHRLHRHEWGLNRSDYEAWLSGTLDAANVVLRQCPVDGMDAWPVSTQANALKSNNAALIGRAAQ
jgi:putative SOS response-associated peptidase YedK